MHLTNKHNIVQFHLLGYDRLVLFWHCSSIRMQMHDYLEAWDIYVHIQKPTTKFNLVIFSACSVCFLHENLILKLYPPISTCRWTTHNNLLVPFYQNGSTFIQVMPLHPASSLTCVLASHCSFICKWMKWNINDKGSKYSIICVQWAEVLYLAFEWSKIYFNYIYRS